MAENVLKKDGEVWYLKVTPNRARALVEALNIALQSGSLDKSIKGVVTSHRNLFASVSSGEPNERDPARYVYIARDIGPQRQEITKIGHTRDLTQRFARMTDRSTSLKPRAAWRFKSAAEAEKHEQEARQKYHAFDGGGGTEFVKAKIDNVFADLRAKWGEPDFLDG